MPHIIVKLWPGRTEEQKQELTRKIVDAVVETANVEESCVSVAFEEILSKDWGKKVYKPDILEKDETLYKKPGYEYSEDEMI